MLDRFTGWLGSLFGRGGPGGGRSGPGGGSGGSSGGKTSDDFWAFLDALRAVSPDYDRYCRVAGDNAAAPALRAVYGLLPQTGKVSRAAVLRRYLAKRAQDDGEQDAAGLISRLSERQLLQLARRAGMPV